MRIPKSWLSSNIIDCLSFIYLTFFKMPFLGMQVDVWSAGVLFYQMLFGRRPFGHDQTQERILREDTIIKARRVEFPTKPTISNEAKVSLI
jgi:serine/threonine protein kinase